MYLFDLNKIYKAIIIVYLFDYLNVIWNLGDLSIESLINNVKGALEVKNLSNRNVQSRLSTFFLENFRLNSLRLTSFIYFYSGYYGFLFFNLFKFLRQVLDLVLRLFIYFFVLLVNGTCFKASLLKIKLSI